MRGVLPLIVATLVMLGACARAGAAEMDRVLRTIDFEERRLGNNEDLPMHWTKVEGPGLPHYVNGILASDRHASGTHSFRFDLNGGGLIYRYDAGQIPVQPEAHYRVETLVQTTVLEHARARLTAYFVDADGNAIPESIRNSALYAAKGENEPWKRLSVELSADFPERGTKRPADSPAGPPTHLVVELALLQPMHYSPGQPQGEGTLFNQDIRGSAWFDDVTVSQVPRVTLSTGRPGNIFRRSDRPVRLEVLVNDRFTNDLAAQLVVSNAAGAVVYQRSGALDMSTIEAAGPGIQRMKLTLPELPPGWYEARLLMTSNGRFVGQEDLDLVLLSDDAIDPTPDPRFGMIATDLPFAGWSELPDILPFLSAGRVKLAVWSEAGDIQQVDPEAFDRLLEQFQDLGIKPTACLTALPPELAEKLKGSSWAEIVKADPGIWRPQLAQLISRHANHLDRWQLGTDGTDAFVTDPAMRQAYATVYDQFASLVYHPELAMPWPAWYELDGRQPETIALSVPSSVLPQQLPLYLQDLQQSRSQSTVAGRGKDDISISLELLDRERYGRDRQIIDLAQRLTYALAAGADRIDLPLPFTVRQNGIDHGDLVKQPREMLIILRTLITTLGGATCRGKVPLAEGVEAFLFERGGLGVMVLWNGATGSGVKHLALNLGPHPMRLDLWGNASPLVKTVRGGFGKMAGAGDESTVAVDLGAFPILLVGVDAAAAQLRASVAIDRPLLESSFEPHSRRIRFVNPYRQAIAGTLKLKGPAGWTINPPTCTFNLNPGETFDREISIEFPYNSFAGAKTLSAEFLVQGEQNVAFEVPIALKLGLSDVGMQAMALRDGQDVIVQQMITNYGEKPIDYSAFAIFPGQARQERLVTNLGPGRTTIKRYRFSEFELNGETSVRCGLKELTGTRILNEEVPVQ